MSLTPAERAELMGFLPAKIRSDADLESFIKGAEVRVSREYFEESYIYALSLMVSHKATMSAMANEGTVGPVTSLREGDITVNYGGGSGSASGDLSATVYGREYEELAKQHKPGPGLTRGIGIGGFCCAHSVKPYF